MTDTLKTVQALPVVELLVQALEMGCPEDPHSIESQAIEAGRALIAQMQRAMQPGWKLVPLEPTTKMIDAAIRNSNEWARGTTDFAGTYRAMLAATTPTPEGWRWILVDGSFAALVLALMRADGKGYMPDAMAEEWEAFNWQEAHEVEQMDAASRGSAAEAQKPNEHESGAAMGTPPADNKENGK